MKNYTNKITLVKNGRGMWDLDPFKGCEDGVRNHNDGCWGLCYAAKIAKFRGYDFSKTIYRDFKNKNHIKSVLIKLSQTSFIDGIQPQFVRLGVMCDPSFDWKHTLKIIDIIRPSGADIVIITKHWKEISNDDLPRLKGLCINTSICALDTEDQIKHRLQCYEKLKRYCKSILRVNTADFNDKILKKKQIDLLRNDNVIDNILRIPKGHNLVKNKIVNVNKRIFLNTNVYASTYNDSTYFGYCDKCPERCGINL